MHASALAGVPTAELVGVCDLDAVRARRLAERHSVPHLFTSANEAIESGRVDFAHVLVPPGRHVSLALEFVDASIGVLIEKPMGRSAAECESLVRASEERGVQIGVNHTSLFYPAY